MKVPSTESLKMLVWVNVCANEVENRRHIAVIITVILKDNHVSEASVS